MLKIFHYIYQYLFQLFDILKSYIWKFFKLLYTSLMGASYFGHTETVKILVAQEGIDINAKNI